jgi:hypothetical protein
MSTAFDVTQSYQTLPCDPTNGSIPMQLYTHLEKSNPSLLTAAARDVSQHGQANPRALIRMPGEWTTRRFKNWKEVPTPLLAILYRDGGRFIGLEHEIHKTPTKGKFQLLASNHVRHWFFLQPTGYWGLPFGKAILYWTESDADERAGFRWILAKKFLDAIGVGLPMPAKVIGNLTEAGYEPVPPQAPTLRIMEVSEETDTLPDYEDTEIFSAPLPVTFPGRGRPRKDSETLQGMPTPAP